MSDTGICVLVAVLIFGGFCIVGIVIAGLRENVKDCENLVSRTGSGMQYDLDVLRRQMKDLEALVTDEGVQEASQLVKDLQKDLVEIENL